MTATHTPAPVEDDSISPYDPDETEGALSVIRRGIAASPALANGVWLSAGMGFERCHGPVGGAGPSAASDR